MDLSVETGLGIEGWDHVVQSLQTILATRLNTRVFRREFGSEVSAMVDAPMNDANVLALYVAVAEAIERWEPRFELADVAVSGSETGQVILTLSGSYRPNAHLGDDTTIVGPARTVRILRDRVDNWSFAA